MTMDLVLMKITDSFLVNVVLKNVVDILFEKVLDGE